MKLKQSSRVRVIRLPKKKKAISGDTHTDKASHNVSIKVSGKKKVKKSSGAGKARLGNVHKLPEYKDKDAAREISVYADNDSDLYRQSRRPILQNLSRKHKKGAYKVDLAAKLWLYYIEAAMKKYNKDFGSRGDKWSNLLSVPDRKLLAMEYAKDTLDEFNLGNYTE